MKCSDPTTMSHAERLAELGELLAAGIQRFLARECKATANPRDPLDVVAAVEAPCGATPELPA
jgi:hypothetical protein